MPTTAPSVGTGTTFTWSTLAGNVLGVRWDGIDVAAIKSTHMGTTGAHSYIKSTLYDSGNITLDIQFPQSALNVAALMGTAASTLTITFPGSGTLIVTAIVTGYSLNSPVEDLMTATVTFKGTGAITGTLA